MATFTKTALVALALAGTAISGAFAQTADQAAPTDQSKQVTPPAPVRSRVATRQILLEPTAPIKVAAVTGADAAPAQVATPAQAAPAPAAAAPAVVAVAPQVAVQAEAVPNQAAPATPAPGPQVVVPNGAPVAPGIVVRKGIEHGYGYSPRYAGGYGYGYRGHNCH
jgi:hypothetical protein